MILKNLQNGGRGGLPHNLKVKPAAAPKPPAALTGDLERNMGTARVPLCQHRMDNAARCKCPAMRGTRYCYSHHHKREQGARKSAERARQRWFESAPLEDVASLQRALVQVMTRLVSDQIDHKQAGQILYKLQTASMNLRSAGFNPRKAEEKPSPFARAEAAENGCGVRGENIGLIE